MTSAQGRPVFNLLSTRAAFERELHRERTRAWLPRQAPGAGGGRHRGLSEQVERPAIITATRYREQQLGVNKIARRRRIATFTR